VVLFTNLLVHVALGAGCLSYTFVVGAWEFGWSLVT
jgi:hypothetical protein